MHGSRRWERLNEVETTLVAVLPARAPHPALVAVSTAARAGGLWLALSAVEALRPGGDRRTARHAAASVLVALTATHVVKRLTPPRARPEAPGGVARRTLPEHPRSSSFPSAHAATSAAFATVVVAHGGAVLLPLPLVVIYSRVRLRVHWPTDVVAGAAIGVAAAVALRRCPGLTRRTTSPGVPRPRG